MKIPARKFAIVAFLSTAVLAALLFAATHAALPDHLLTGRSVNGEIFAVTNQLLHPSGRQALIPGRPVDIAIAADGARLAVLNSNRVDIFDSLTGQLLGTMNTGSATYAGVAFRPASGELWASGGGRGMRQPPPGAAPGAAVGPSEAGHGQMEPPSVPAPGSEAGAAARGRGMRGGGGTGNTIAVATVDSHGHPGDVSRIALPGRAIPVGIGFTSDGSRAYVALNRNNTVAVIDAQAHKLLREIPVGMAPFGVAVAEKRGRVFVANRGGRHPKPGENTSTSSGAAMLTDPISGTTTTGTVSVIGLKDDSVREVTVGLAPSMLTLSPDGKTVAVANSHGDSISFIDSESLAVSEVKIPTWPESTVGSQPVGVAFSPDGSRLYVACAGNNALAVLALDRGRWHVAGALPTGWFPSSVVTDERGTIHLVTIKGAADTNTPRGYRSTSYQGSLETISAPTLAQAAAGQREVQRLNEPKFEGAGGNANLSSLGVRHVILVIKENRTYDQVLGDMPKGNGDARFVEFGRDVTPNTHALAEQFVLLDNFYTTGAISFDGHQWLMMAFVSDHTERALGSSPRGYAWNMADSLGVAPTGFFWQGAAKPLSLRLYGEFCVAPQSDTRKGEIVESQANPLPGNWAENLRLWRDGKLERRDSCGSGVPALEPFVDRKFQAAIGMTDQFKTDEFLNEFAEFEKAGNLPQLSVVTLNNDHTRGTSPGSGTPRAMVADNDLAVGRLVERVSKSPFWEHTLILVTEDDAQNGLDHVDGHRTLCLAIGPHVKRGAVDSANYNHLGMIRTIQEIFSVPARTRFAQAARPMSSIFTKTPDLKPFVHIEPRIDIAEMNPPIRALQGRARQAAQESMAMDFSDVDRAPRDTLNRIIWWSVKGFDTPYPGRQQPAATDADDR